MTDQTTTPEELEALLARAAEAAPGWAARSPADRAGTLTAVADALDERADELLPLAKEESRLPDGRLAGELKRTTFQLRLFAELLRDGAYLDARVDHADADWPMGARPDIRRVLMPLGPVLNFAAGNFPFAFSVAGGDTAAALAAGCPVLVKVHPGHPRLSARTGAVVAGALRAAGAPDGVFGLIHGVDQGVTALRDPRVKAASFTGSIPGGRALFDIACSRPEPIPFYGELGSVNPTFVTRAADAARAEEITEGFVGSFTLGAGQFCTKPGVLAVPEGSAVLERLRSTTLPGPAPMLTSRFAESYARRLGELAGHDAVGPLAVGEDAYTDPPAPALLTASIEDVLADGDELLAECFGPAALVVTYTEESQLVALAGALDGQLTATIVGEDDDAVAPELVRLLADRAGRVLWNQWPTGVSVTYAQQHGGPYPATTAPTTTSVGTAAISRFLRPVAYQGFPDHLLPDALKETNPESLPRLVDGKPAV
ncbi:aldehyde dehydrogenase (NADP(+)) [Streptomyces sp. MP131-18]|uniref:aldehyde dehydrogenase (NADP(+)) n=1 Tax=Streptomyces sp. MP131-18 TaxID=1857892 RepID=UPI00097BDCAF|nr:aldehyde dehydrogenase (NADP(+)) [Streptomyces sp. MP131-18]ONK09684.1 NADP-dependent fatty aldehyde dehydrogenase [Streptomyces sp. MP131-18]